MKFIIWRRYKWLFIGLIILILVILFLGILLYSFPVSLFQILLLVNKQSTCMNHYNHEHFLNLPFYSYRTTYPWKSWSRINWKMSRYWCSDRQWDTTNREPVEMLFLCIFLYFYPPKILEYITYTKCYFVSCRQHWVGRLQWCEKLHYICLVSNPWLCLFSLLINRHTRLDSCCNVLLL